MEAPETRVCDPDPEVRYRAVLELVGGQSLPLLLARLSDDSWRVRKAAVERLAALSVAEGAVDKLVEKLRSADDAGARNAAAEALARIGAPAVPELSRCLKDPDIDLRKFAADILGEIAAPSSVLPLVDALTDPDPNVHAAAAEALGKIGGPRAEGALEGALESNDRQLQLAALDALFRTGAVPPLAVLAPLVKDRYLRRPVLRILGRLQEKAVLELLVDALRDPARGTREVVFASLHRHLQPQGDRGGAALSRVVAADPRRAVFAAFARDAITADDPDASSGAVLLLGILGEPVDVQAIAKAGADERVREACILALERMGAPAGGPLLKALPGLPPASRPLALLLLARLRERSATAMMVEYAGHGSDEERAAAIEGLGDLGDLAAIEPLTQMLDDQLFALAASRALCQLGKIDAAAVRTSVVPLLGGTAAPHALRVLGAVGTQDDLPLVKSALHSEFPEVRMAAIDALQGLLGAGAEEMMRLCLSDESPAVRAVAARGLGRFSSPETFEALLATLNDRKPAVAAAAAESLGAIGDRRAVPDLERCIARGTAGPGSPEVLPAIAAVRALAKLSALNGKLLLGAAAHPDPEVVKEAVLAAITHPEADPVLLGAAVHARWDVRRAAAQAIGERGDRRLLERLEELLRDEKDPIVRDALSDAVRTLHARPTRAS